MRLRWLLWVSILPLWFPLALVSAQTATPLPPTPTHTPELSHMITVIPPGGDLSDAQDAVLVYEISDGDMLTSALLFLLIVLLLLSTAWSFRRGNRGGASSS